MRGEGGEWNVRGIKGWVKTCWKTVWIQIQGWFKFECATSGQRAKTGIICEMADGFQADAL